MSSLEPWRLGAIDPGLWAARWVGPTETTALARRQRPGYLLAGRLHLPGEVAGATVMATAHGLYELFVNGERVGDRELTPGWTAYRRRLEVQRYDVTHLLGPGDNTVGALLTDGWWRGQNGVARATDAYGTTTAFLAQLHLTLGNGETLVWGTGPGWRSTAGHVLGADLIAGEVHDLRRRVPGWADPGADHSDWDPVVDVDAGMQELRDGPSPPVRRVQELSPVSITTIERDGRTAHVVDLGQNIAGWVRLAGLGPEGNEVTLTYGEALDAEGDVTQANVARGIFDEPDDGVGFQRDSVVSAGDDVDVFEPRHSTKGFRYVRVEGRPGELTPADVTGVVVHTDLERRGGFDCSVATYNAIHRIAEWSFRTNACDLPTDCPTRERSGWTGDWQIYVPTAAYLYDVDGFSRKWLRDLAADQWADGAVTNIVPEPDAFDGRGPDFWKDMVGSAGWGDASVHVPWELYQESGDPSVLDEQWTSMTAWVDFAAAAAAAGRHHTRIARSAEAAAHERFLWDTGYHFGEWLETGVALNEAVMLAMTDDHGPLATAYLHRSAAELAAAADLLGRSDASARYRRLADDVLDAWRLEFMADDGSVTPHTQAGLARALAFGLVPERHRPNVAAGLAALVRGAGNHVGTGFLTTPFLLPVLADHGHLDLAYALLDQDTVPSWAVMVRRGATTVWEEWEGIDEHGVAHASLNHYSKGAVISFLHRYTAGLQRLAPGWRRVGVAPRPGGGVRWASTHHDTPQGRVDLRWELDDGVGRLDLEVPEGVTALVDLPDGQHLEVGDGRHRFTWSA